MEKQVFHNGIFWFTARKFFSTGMWRFMLQLVDHPVLKARFYYERGMEYWSRGRRGKMVIVILNWRNGSDVGLK